MEPGIISKYYGMEMSPDVRGVCIRCGVLVHWGGFNDDSGKTGWINPRTGTSWCDPRDYTFHAVDHNGTWLELPTARLLDNLRSWVDEYGRSEHE
jgi:hypothetical protein